MAGFIVQGLINHYDCHFTVTKYELNFNLNFNFSMATNMTKNCIWISKQDLGNCIMDCCVKHGLPIHCVQQNLDSITSADHNNTHVVVTSILSKECHDYKKILKECKAECVAKD